MCQYLDKKKYIQKRNKIRFPYIKPDGKKATYQPDFYVDDWNSYVEVKGYETELDKCKWSQITNPLIIIRKKEIKNMVGCLEQ